MARGERDESLCPGGASPPDIGRKAYCPGKRRPVLPDVMTGKDMPQKGRVMPERSQGRLERRVGRGMRPILRTAALRGYRRR